MLRELPMGYNRRGLEPAGRERQMEPLNLFEYEALR